jgi:hypothetical protein
MRGLFFPPLQAFSTTLPKGKANSAVEILSGDGEDCKFFFPSLPRLGERIVTNHNI